MTLYHKEEEGREKGQQARTKENEGEGGQLKIEIGAAGVHQPSTGNLYSLVSTPLLIYSCEEMKGKHHHSFSTLGLN